MLNAQKSKSGLDLDVPLSGRAADAHEVACTALWLAQRTEQWPGQFTTKRTATVADASPLRSARHATALHVISGRLHRLSERQCNEDLACEACEGAGFVLLECKAPGAPIPDPMRASDRADCRACAGTGLTTGRTVARLERQATEIAAHYGCRAYFQGDPRGCALYLVPGEIVPNAGGELDRYAYGKPTPFAMLQERWIEAHYTRGHAVPRLGR